jgi:hypothetical protein
MERSPEVFQVLQAMDKTGVNVFVDVHGVMHEELPYNFIAGAEGCPNWSSRLEALQGVFLAAYCRANSDMQPIFGYDPEARTGTSKDDSIATCSIQIATRFDLSRSDVGTSNPLRIACPIPIRHGVGIQHAPNCWVPPCWMLYSTCTHYFSEADADSDFWTKLPPTRCQRDSHKQV